MDVRLAAELRAALPRRHRVAAVAALDARGVRTAVLGVPPGSDFEIGSVSKGLTGLLYADALDRGELTASTPLAELLPDLAGAPAGRVTAGSLSTHRSGLPRLPPGMHPHRRSVDVLRHGTNPYRETLPELLALTRQVRVGRPRPAYSNLGFELLGHAVAAAAGTSYQDLLRQRLAEPVGLGCCYAPYAVSELGPHALTGRGGRGGPREPWVGEALAPAGGVRASVGSMGTLLEALLAGTAPGVRALEPRADFTGGLRIGAAWLTVRVREREVTWHNGRTGGFASFAGMDRGARTGVVLLSATSSGVDRVGLRLLEGLHPV